MISQLYLFALIILQGGYMLLATDAGETASLELTILFASLGLSMAIGER